MKDQPKDIKALGLCSGGLDSILAGLVLRDQGINVEWITFETPFFSADKARKASQITEIPLTVERITPIYLEMLKNPNCGYGKYMNPCMDCHALMFRLAGEKMQKEGFHFLFSGEVAGQRPMSQTKPSLRYVEKHSGFDGHILRPLTAKVLPETIPEKEGWVDRDRLLAITGRGRKDQMALAEQYGITDYPAPAGGCLLTDKKFSERLKDLFAQTDAPSEDQLHLLKYGRHLRVDAKTKVIVGRTREENEKILEHYRPQADALIRLKGIPGPLVLVQGEIHSEKLLMAGAIGAGYSKAKAGEPAAVYLTTPAGREIVELMPMPRGEMQALVV